LKVNYLKCPWCEKYVEFYSEESGNLTEEDIEEEKDRLKSGFWSSIENVQYEWELINKRLTTEAALKMRMPVHIDMKSGETHFGRFWMYSLAENRDQVMKEALEHYWILSGGCSMSWTTPICCELANVTSDSEAIEFEMQKFKDLIQQTRKVNKLIETEY